MSLLHGGIPLPASKEWVILEKNKKEALGWGFLYF